MGTMIATANVPAIHAPERNELTVLATIERNIHSQTHPNKELSHLNPPYLAHIASYIPAGTQKNPMLVCVAR